MARPSRRKKKKKKKRKRKKKQDLGFKLVSYAVTDLPEPEVVSYGLGFAWRLIASLKPHGPFAYFTASLPISPPSRRSLTAVLCSHFAACILDSRHFGSRHSALVSLLSVSYLVTLLFSLSDFKR